MGNDAERSDPLDPVIRAILDGRALDEQLPGASTLSEDERALLRPLRVLAAIGALQGLAGLRPAGGDDDRFELRELIGRGAFGDVYRAWDGRLHREVALKIVDLERPFAGSVLAEARRLARVRHPNVVTIYDVHEAGGEGRISMELLSGSTLQDAVREHPLPFDQVLTLARTLLRALGAVHRAGMVHGDLKPNNIMLEPSGRVVLMDFGAGMETGAVGTIRAATPRYMAPELFEGHSSGAASDLFSLGVLLFFLLTGGYPTSGSTPDSIRRQLARGDAARAALRRIPPPLGGVLARAMATRPEARFPTAEAFDEALAVPASPPRHFFTVSLLLVVVALCSLAWSVRSSGSAPAGRSGGGTWQLEMPPSSIGAGALSADGSLMVFGEETGGIGLLNTRSGFAKTLVTGQPSEPVVDTILIDDVRRTAVYGQLSSSCACVEVREVPLEGGLPRTLLQTRFHELFLHATTTQRDQVLVQTREAPEGSELRLLDLITGHDRLLVRSRPNIFGADLSGDGRYVVYGRPDADGVSTDLVMFDVGTGSEWLLASGRTEDALPLWTGDDRGVVFASDRAGGWGLWFVPIADGRAAGEPVLFERDMGRYIPIYLSADGSLLHWRSPVLDIELAPWDDVTSSVIDAPRRPLMGVSGSNTAPSWSPDGTALAYGSERKPMGTSRSVIVVHTLADGQEREIHVPVDGPLEPAWSPDGTRLLIRGPGTKDGVRGAHIVDPSAGRMTTSFEHPGTVSHQWRPDSRAYYFVNQDGIRRMDLASRRLESLPLAGGWVPAAIAVSPSGKELAVNATRGTRAAVLIVSADGGDPRVLVEGPQGTSVPRVWDWTPAGDRLVGVERPARGDEAMGRLVTIRTSDGKRVEAGLERPGLSWARVSPDGRQIAYRTGPNVRTLWIREGVLPPPMN